MAKNKKWIFLLLAAVLLSGIVAMVFGFFLPYMGAGSKMPEQGEFVINQQQDGSLLLSWPAADQADYYCLEFLIPGETEKDEPEVVFRDFIHQGTSCVLPQLPENMILTMRVRPVVEYKTFGKLQTRFSTSSLEVTTDFQIPIIWNFQWGADPVSQKLSARFQMRDGDHCHYFLLRDGREPQDLGILDTGALEIQFGDEMELPAFGESFRFVFAALRQQPGLKFYGAQSAQMTVVRDDLLGREINLKCVDRGNNVFTLTWDETKGEHYEVQILDSDSMQWKTVSEIAGDGDRCYTSAHMPPFEKIMCRVVAVGGQTMENSTYAAVSEEITYTTQACAVYATVWPTKDLEAYTDPQKTEEAGRAETGRALCVLGEEDGMFAVRLDGAVRYIDSNYCLINLPEYVGSLCRYEITNSNDSIYMMHDFEIPGVTGVVTAGYEHVMLADGSYLVPLLYPTAKKLAEAGQEAMAQGYRLKIYDAFRPNVATREIYSRTERILDDPLPAQTYVGVSREQLDLPSPDEGAEELTYRMVMTGGRYDLHYFLAKGRSMHNLGIALDLTLENLETGHELSMQSAIHDLSCYSVLSRNNAAAKVLAQIMKGAGFGDLVSEWWHFQDNEAKSGLDLPTVRNGVSAACWMNDGIGWKYRTETGEYCMGETVSIDGTDYTFDENGYTAQP